ncbi:thioesterase [Streptomyces xanthophaeus]|uniref:Thioesterase n=2 Tax=Streptomyces xanthophaeus TaxID=67385 RepID=A0A919LCI4_9ACTN|nr:thioesterase [Streptomyces xanthophaeus]
MSAMSHALPLLCLPFAGAGASFYKPWCSLGVEGVEVRPLQLPGRERLLDQDPYTDVHAAADGLLADALEAAGDGPVAVFGHSLGAILAYELAHRIADHGAGELVHLFVSGSQGPWNGRTERATGLDDDAFLARVQEFAGYTHPAFEIPEMRELLLPTLRADVEMHEAYAPASERKLTAPITSVRGVDDHLVSAEAAGHWRDATSAAFTAVDVPGDHMYLDADAKSLLELIASRLRSGRTEN